MARRQPITGPDAATAVMVAAAAGMPMPPSHIRMSDDDMRYWPEIVAEFSALEWTPHALSVAALLSRNMHDAEREQWQLRGEGSVIMNERGTPVCNPRRQAVALATQAVLALRRTLSLHARAKQGEARDVAKTRGVAHQHAEASPLHDDLIARPSHN